MYRMDSMSSDHADAGSIREDFITGKIDSHDNEKQHFFRGTFDAQMRWYVDNAAHLSFWMQIETKVIFEALLRSYMLDNGSDCVGGSPIRKHYDVPSRAFSGRVPGASSSGGFRGKVVVVSGKGSVWKLVVRHVEVESFEMTIVLSL